MDLLTRPDKLWELAQQIDAGVFQGVGQVLRASVLEALPSIRADVAYFDPPYPGVMSYEKEYRFIDEILEGASRPTSPFTAKDGASMLDTLFEKATHIPIWILSLGNAVVGIEELEAKMLKLGRQTKAIALRYQHLPAVATEEKKRENREFLVVGWDSDAPLLRGLSGAPSEGGNRDFGEELDRAVAGVHVDADPIGSQGATLELLQEDGSQEFNAPIREQAAAYGRGLPVSERESGVDGPDPILGEACLDRERKFRIDAPVRHRSNFAGRTQEVK